MITISAAVIFPGKDYEVASSTWSSDLPSTPSSIYPSSTHRSLGLPTYADVLIAIAVAFLPFLIYFPFKRGNRGGGDGTDDCCCYDCEGCDCNGC